MKRRVMIFALSAVALLGCNKASKAPEPLSLEEIPAEMTKAFQSAPAAVRQQSDGIVASVKSKNYSAASLQLGGLSGVPELTEGQRNVTARATMAVNQYLQSVAEGAQTGTDGPAQNTAGTQPTGASPQENAAAAAALEQYSRTK